MSRKFTSLFNLSNTTQASEKTASKGPLIVKVLKANALFDTPLRQKQLKEIHTRVSIPEKYYKALYLPVLNNVAEYFQSLPDTIVPYLKNGGLLTHALERGVYLLRLREKHPINLDHTPKHRIDSETPLLTYVMFTATLLRDMGIVATNYPVQLVNEQGEFIKDWDAYVGNMVQQHGEYYRFREAQSKALQFSRQATPMLAREMLPKEGFQWISSDERALKTWIALLCDNESSGGGVSLLLRLVEEELQKAHSTGEHHINEVTLDSDLQKLSVVAYKEAPHVEVGELFATWLKEGIANGSITVNQTDSHVHTSEDGLVLIYPEIFQDFCVSYPRFKDWAVVYKQFNHLGLHALSGEDKLFYRFFGETEPGNTKIPIAAKTETHTHAEAIPTKTVQGLLLSNRYNFLPSNFDQAQISTHLKVDVTANSPVTKAIDTPATAPMKNPFAGVVIMPPKFPDIADAPKNSGPHMGKK